MKKLLIILLTLSSCTVKVHTKNSRCAEILDQRDGLLSDVKTESTMKLIKQTDSLYIISSCDTIK